MDNQDFVIDEQFRQRHRKLTTQEQNNLRHMIAEYEPRDGSIVLGFIDGHKQKYLIDGHNTVDICKEQGKELPRPIVIIFKSREDILKWIDQNQRSRRNLSMEEMAKARAERIQRVVDSRQEGQSTRAIAEIEGISQPQVIRDLQTATDTGVSVTPESGKVLGLDKIKRPAQKPTGSLFCERCNRLGAPVKDCVRCKEIQAKARQKPKAKKKQQGKSLFNWKELDKHFGYVARWPDMIIRAYPQENGGSDFKEAMKLLGKLADLKKVWFERLTK